MGTEAFEKVALETSAPSVEDSKVLELNTRTLGWAQCTRCVIYAGIFKFLPSIVWVFLKFV